MTVTTEGQPMKVYSRTGAQAVGSDDYGDFTPEADGSFDVPHDFGVLLVAHIDGVPAWEDEPARHERLTAEDLKRRRDPAAAYDLLAQLLGTAKANEVLGAPEPEPEDESPTADNEPVSEPEDSAPEPPTADDADDADDEDDDADEPPTADR